VEFFITLDESKMRGKSAGGRQKSEERVDEKSRGWIMGRKKKEFGPVTCIKWKQCLKKKRMRKIRRPSYADSVKRDLDMFIILVKDNKHGSGVLLNQKFYFLHGFTHDKTVDIENTTNKRNKIHTLQIIILSFLVSKFQGSVQKLHN
jgi:hypothetical protein